MTHGVYAAPPAPIGRTEFAACHPWPQPSPWFPDAMLPAVLHIPDEDVALWHERVCSRYQEQLVRETPLALFEALRRPALDEVPDAVFAARFADGPIARFLCAELDPPDLELFADLIAQGPGEGRSFVKADFRVMALVAPDEESAVAPVVVLFVRSGPGRLAVVAIALGDDVFLADGSGAFELAKYFALQAAGVCLTIQAHPQLHFPFDALNAIARTRLPRGHRLRSLLEPHLPLELAIADAVLHGSRSVLRPGHVYSPYPTTHDEALRLVQTIWTGYLHRDGSENRAYPRFRYPVIPPRVDAPYGGFLDRYFEVVRGFVHDVLATVPDDDRDAADFARHAAHFLPGFPGSHAGEHRRDFADAIATMVFTVSIAHTSDHALYGEVDAREVPFRLRAERPSPGDAVTVDRVALTDTDDLVSYALCSKLFFEPHPVARLVDADYDFVDPALRRRAARFLEELRLAEERMVREGLRIYVPLDRMAASIQF